MPDCISLLSFCNYKIFENIYMTMGKHMRAILSNTHIHIDKIVAICRKGVCLKSFMLLNRSHLSTLICIRLIPRYSFVAFLVTLRYFRDSDPLHEQKPGASPSTRLAHACVRVPACGCSSLPGHPWVLFLIVTWYDYPRREMGIFLLNPVIEDVVFTGFRTFPAESDARGS